MRAQTTFQTEAISTQSEQLDIIIPDDLYLKFPSSSTTNEIRSPIHQCNQNGISDQETFSCYVRYYQYESFREDDSTNLDHFQQAFRNQPILSVAEKQLEKDHLRNDISMTRNYQQQIRFESIDSQEGQNKVIQCTQEQEDDIQNTFQENPQEIKIAREYRHLEKMSNSRKNSLPKKSDRSNFCSAYKRRDFVFKTILRQMKKTITNEFNQVTGYIKERRFQDPEFLSQKIDQYMHAKKFINGPKMSDINENMANEIKYFLGALMYHKHYSNIFDSKKQEINAIHKCLYSFSICKLEYLKQFKGFVFLLHQFIQNYQSVVIESNSTMKTNKNDFENAFDYLIKFYQLQ